MQKVLIIDDEVSVLESMSQIVKLLGYQVISYDNPIEAIEIYREYSPDIVLTDRIMPEMDGITCVKKIKKIKTMKRYKE